MTLTGWPSVTGTPGEVAFAPKLLDLVQGWPYFQANPDHAWTSPALASNAQNLYLMVRGRTPRTVMLSGHYDTVATDCYGEHRPLAHTPEALTAALGSSLEGAPLNASETLALDDLRSGEFLAGRGLLDMKGGVAAGLAVLERYAARPAHQRPGHLLLVLSPDEEVMSRGARQVATDLPGVARRHDLDIRLGINLDATNDVTDGQEGRAAYLGTVGKVLVWTLVVGRPTHAAYPHDGTSAALIGAELLREVEGHPGFSDAAHGESSPPPVCLEWRDLRSGYDVTTPGAFWAAFNVLTHQRTPRQVLAQFTVLASLAASRAVTRQARHARRWGSASASALAEQQPEILTFQDLRARAVTRAGEAAVCRACNADPGAPDPLLATREAVQALAAMADLQGPAVVIGLACLHYPHTHVATADPAGDTETWLRKELRSWCSATGETVKVRPFFAGISDMSFLGHAPAMEDEAVRQQTPCPAHVHTPPPGALQFPVINLGPWGRDYHQRLERIHQPYAFGTLPALLWHLLHARLAK